MMMKDVKAITINCVKSVRVWSFSGPQFPALGQNFPYSVRMQENTEQKNSGYGHFSRSDNCLVFNKHKRLFF